jgi:hypothetical protein
MCGELAAQISKPMLLNVNQRWLNGYRLERTLSALNITDDLFVYPYIIDANKPHPLKKCTEKKVILYFEDCPMLVGGNMYTKVAEDMRTFSRSYLVLIAVHWQQFLYIYFRKILPHN